MKKEKTKDSRDLFISLSELREEMLDHFIGIHFDPVFEAVAMAEEAGLDIDGLYSTVQCVDWDDFALVIKTHEELRKWMDRQDRERKSKARGGWHGNRRLPDKTCKKCGAIFRPKGNSREFCSTKCQYGSRLTTDGTIAKQLSQSTGMSVQAIKQRLKLGWSVEKILATPKHGTQKRKVK